MKKHLIFFLLITASITLKAQNYRIGHLTRTMTDPSRNRPIPVEIYYPADSDGNNVPFTQQPITAPIVTFGHGFVMTWDAYVNVWNALVSHGYVIAFPTTESGFSPVHLEMGKDLAFLVTALQAEGVTPASLLYGRLDSAACVMGHSMGGGASFLAVQFNSSIRTMVNFAAAETTPSAIAAASGIVIPSLVFSGGNDCVTPPAAHQIPMYDSLASSCKTYISMVGASHCQFADPNTLCSFGEATCTPAATISRTDQHDVMNRYMIPWLDFHLKGDCAAGATFDSLLVIDSQINYQRTCQLCPAPTSVAALQPLTWSIGPNPVRDHLTIFFDEASVGRLEVCNMAGATIFSQIILEGSHSAEVFLNGLPAGTYLVRYYSPFLPVSTRTFMKQD